MRIFLLLLVLVVAVFLVGSVLLVNTFGWWAIPVILIGLAVAAYGVKTLVSRSLKRLFLKPFQMKGAALKGARVQIHRVSGGAAPAREEPDDDGQPLSALRWLSIEMTVTPAQTEGPFNHWEPGELLLVDANAPCTPDDIPDSESEIGEILVYNEGQFQADEGYKYTGEQRLKLQVGLPVTLQRVRFQYYFEPLGEPFEIASVT